MDTANFFHSVTLDRDKCHGCINCVKRCPTEAIRVRGGKAKIIKERCIDCGECIRVCPHHAKQAIFDPLSVMDRFTYKIALPAPALYGQFNNLDDIDLILGALLLMGFDEVFEVARAAELVSDATRRYMAQEDILRPVVSSACPAVLRLIRVRFPELIEHVLPMHAPIEVAARMAKKHAAEKTGLPPEQIGAIFISPCPAKVTAVKMPLGSEKSCVDGVLAIREVYPKLISLMREVPGSVDLARTGRMGIGWGSSGGEAAAALKERYLAADGIENVIRVLEDLEDEKFYDLDFVELNACSGGCVGGVLTIENPYVARAKLKRIRKYRPVSCNHIDGEDLSAFFWDEAVEYEPVLELDADFRTAMEKMKTMREIEARLYGMDCGSCGAPSCKALAEDIVRGFSTEEACIFKLREEIDGMAESLRRLSRVMPKADGDKSR
ncbi:MULTISPECIES: [Fe-Fe] hydrogenase large subunit C-terminal domain-containing protein [Anaerotruncus]|jgi:iron only hydrogenase large subunit-like protein|uniref:4Fe-4S dicluster domain-containing protein n=1 Tax=Anaerotruncus colihominis TaxID=169435 RepID=A0A845RKG2_9FIRM|nr:MULTISPECIES: [Fe-Fe] hydrogenase large subunit C-terminal domain-containing protein [Anaerotruncus]MCI8491907.1 4Fe-4S binding protein [Anaerotruncus sp.]MCR2026381.1 4Fe-4S binding protein [Anaerotruncus colihominis]NBI79261.1 4Fe-4S dicluster domain-containing protein [Anaerotruncus colihominis]NDO40632.1 4Fe-4S dicluster domain-containing protein [Anaerotruncus colihominis]